MNTFLFLELLYIPGYCLLLFLSVNDPLRLIEYKRSEGFKSC